MKEVDLLDPVSYKLDLIVMINENVSNFDLHHGYQGFTVASANTKKHSDTKMHVDVLRVCPQDASENEYEARAEEDSAATNCQRKRHANKVCDTHKHGWKCHKMCDVRECSALWPIY